MAYNDSILDVIDQRVQAAQVRESAAGTVVSVDSSALRATVIFDGSALAVPVKVFGHVSPRAGDRAGLQRFGSDWVVVGVWANVWPANNGVHAVSPGGNTTSTTAVDVPGSPSFTFIKRWDATRLWLTYSGTQETSVDLRLYYGIEINAVTYEVARIRSVVADNRMTCTGAVWVSGIAAGSYTAKGKWWKDALFGGQINKFVGDDSDSFGVEEIGPP